jgi:hypothetical protein
VGRPSTSARYSFSTPKDGWVRRCVRSPSLVSSSSPSVSASSRPTGNTRGSGHEVDDHRPALRVVRGGHDAGRLVEQVVHQPGRTPRRRRRRLDHVALDVDPAPELGGLAVHRDPALGDQLLADPPAAEAGPGQHLLQALAPLGSSAVTAGSVPGGGTRRGTLGVARVRSPAARSSPLAGLVARVGPALLAGRVGAQALLELLDHLGAGHEVAERGQVVEGVEAELLEERRAWCRTAPAGPDRGRGPPRRCSPAAERAHDAIDVHAPDGATWARLMGCL